MSEPIVHTAIEGQQHQLPGAPFFPVLSFALTSQRADDQSDPVLLGMQVSVFHYIQPTPPGTPHIPVGGIAAVAVAIDNPIAGTVGEFDVNDRIVTRTFVHFRDQDDNPWEADPNRVGWMFQPLTGSLGMQLVGSKNVIWTINPNIGFEAFVAAFGQYPGWVNNPALLTELDPFTDEPLGFDLQYIDIIPTQQANFNQPRRYFVLLALTELMPDNAHVQVSLDSLDLLPALDPHDASAALENPNPVPFPIRVSPAFLLPAASVLSFPNGADFTIVANVGDGSFPGEAVNANGIPQMANSSPDGGTPGGALPDSGPGYFPGYQPSQTGTPYRLERGTVGPYAAPVVHSMENRQQVLSLELATNQIVGSQAFFSGFGLFFQQLGEYREIPGDGIDNDGDSWELQRNGIDDNGDGEDNDGNPATVAIADGIDNDGDGLTDEGIDDPMEGVDETYRITRRGFDGVDNSPLVNGQYQAELAPTPFGWLPIADGIDNDGDGLIDEGIDEVEEAIGLDPFQMAGRNEDKDYRTLEGLGIREAPFLYENGLDDDMDGVTDNAGEGLGPIMGILRYQAAIFHDDERRPFSDRPLTGEAMIDYVSRTFITLIELGQHPDYPGFVAWATGPNNRLMAETAFGTLPVIYPVQIIGLDNDWDGLYDEDPRDGMDNDGDGLIDEDVTWCPLIPAIDEERLDYFVDGFSIFGANRRGVYDQGADELYVDFNMNGVFDLGFGDGNNTTLSEYRGGGRGFPTLRNGESYFQPGLVFPLDNDGDGEDNDNNPATPPIADGIDNDGDGFTDEGFNEDVTDLRSSVTTFLNWDGAVPPVQVFRDNRDLAVAGTVPGFWEPTDARMEVGAAPDPFNPGYVVVSFLQDAELLILPQSDDANFDFFVVAWCDSTDGTLSADLFGNLSLAHGDDFMIRVLGSDVGLNNRYGGFLYDVGELEGFVTALVPGFEDAVDYLFQGVPQAPGGYPAGRLTFRQYSKRQVGRLHMGDMAGELRGLADNPSSPWGTAVANVQFENAFRNPPEPIYQLLAGDLSHTSNMGGLADFFLDRDFPVLFSQNGFPVLQPMVETPMPLIGLNVVDASAGEVSLESIDQIRVNFVDASIHGSAYIGGGRFEPSDLAPLRSEREGEVPVRRSGVSIYFDRTPAALGDADDDGDGEDNDNNPATPAIADGIDNDGDGLTDEGINEDDIDFIDNDGDGLTDEDPPYYQTAPGVFDPNDVLMPLNLAASSWDPDPTDPVVVAGGHYVVLTPEFGLPIPPHDQYFEYSPGVEPFNNDFTDEHAGFDYFIAVTGSETMDNGDSFLAFIRPGDILFSAGRNIQGSYVQSGPVKATVPMRVGPSPGSGALTRNSRSIPVLNINTHDGNNMFDPRFVYDMPHGEPGSQRLRSLWLQFDENLDGSIPPLRRFTPSDLAPLNNLLVPSPNTGRLMSQSGVALYRDMPGSDTPGGFDDPDDPNVVVPDTPVLLSGEEAFGIVDGRPGVLRLELDPPLYFGNRDVSPIDPYDPDPYETLPPNDVGENEGADFFVVVRTSNTISEGDSFYVKVANVRRGDSDTGQGLQFYSMDFWPANPHHLRHPHGTFLSRSWDIGTQTGVSNQMVNSQPFDGAPTMTFLQPRFIPNQTDPTPISVSYKLIWRDFDEELDNDGDANTFTEVNLYYAPFDNLSQRTLINTTGPINGSLDGPFDEFDWDLRLVPSGVYRVLGTIYDRVNPVVLALGGLVEVINVPPDIQVTAPVGENAVAGGVVKVRWIDSDPENDAKISLYIVPATGSATGATDGILLVSGLSEDSPVDEYDVDLDPLLAAGVIHRGMTYFFLAAIDDGVAGPFRPRFSRSPGTITIQDVPTVRIVNPGTPPIQDLLLYYDVTWTDRVPEGRSATLELFYSASNFGYANDAAVTQPINLPAVNRIAFLPGVENLPNKVFRWEVSDGTRLFPGRPGPGDYYIFARITDNLSNSTGNFSAGRLRISDHALQVFSLESGVEYAIESYRIRWAAASVDPGARLAIYYDDNNEGFNGRLVARVSLFDFSYDWLLYRDGDATQRNVPVGSFYLYFEVEDSITGSQGPYRFYSRHPLSIGVPAVDLPKVLLADGRSADPSRRDELLLGKSLFEGMDVPEPRVLSAVGSATAHPGLYVLDESGAIYAVGEAEALPGPHLATGKAVDLERSPRGGYYVLESNGEIHSLGGAPELPGIFLADGSARDMELTPDGKGAYILDGYGRIHRVGQTTLTASFNLGVDIARDLALTPDGKGLYVLDGYGGVHVAGTARRLPGPVFGSDLAVDLWVDPSGAGYYILDKFGGIHACGAVPQLPSVRLSTPIARDLFDGGQGDLGIFWTLKLTAEVPADAPLDPDPDTDGEWVVWVVSGPGRPTGSDIAYARVADGVVQTLSIPGNQSEPAVDHGVLVYTSRENLDDDIYMIPDLADPSLRINLSRGFNVPGGTRGTDNQRQPTISVREIGTPQGPRALGAIAWSAYDSANREWDVYLQLIARNAEGRFAPVPGSLIEISENTNQSDQRDPAVYITNLEEDRATIMLVYSDNRGGDLDLVYATVQVVGTGLSNYAYSGGVLVRDLVRRPGPQVDPRISGGNVVYTDESAGGDIYEARFSLTDPRNPVPAGSEIAVATAPTREFAGRVAEGRRVAWIDRYSGFFDVVVSDPRIAVFDAVFPGLGRPQRLGLVSPLNGFAEVYNLEYSDGDGGPEKWLVWSERREGRRRVLLYEQSVRAPTPLR